MPTFSVIIPVYNAAQTIERCVNSIVASNDKDVEIILIEDCSKDNSLEICLRLKACYDNIQLLVNKHNRGVSYSRNRGLDAATGDYLLFCDSDDWVEPEWSTALLSEMQNNPGWIPICGYYLENSTDLVKKQCLWSDYGTIKRVSLSDAFDLLDKVLLQQLWTKAFYRKIIITNKVYFDETQSMGEDLQFVLDYLCVANLKGFSLISKPLYHYDCNTGTLMRKFGLVNRDEEYRRLLQLGQITGNQERCEASLEALRKNHIYHILRSKLSYKEKWALAKDILGKEATSFFFRQQLVILKENIFHIFQISKK